jgi:hypothetical protein
VSENRKTPVPPEPTRPDERRRIGTIVHDDRGNASVEWRAAPPAEKERPVLEVLGEGHLTLKSEEVSYDPYSTHRTRERGSGKRTDLRKLSEWIKKMRELEERKRNGGGDE